MNSRKVLDGIMPFNEFFYKSCFYNSLFPAVLYFKKSITPFLMNDIVLYQYERTFELNAKYLPIKDEEKILEETGLVAYKKGYSSRIIEDIINAISNGRIVIIWIDCYYESLRADAFGKVHRPHTLVIFGFDDKNHECNIIEHVNFDSLSYEKKVISYVDIINSYQGYKLNFHQFNESPTYFEFDLKYKTAEMSMTGETPGTDIDSFLCSMKDYSNKIFEGIEKILEYKRDIIGEMEAENTSTIINFDLLNRLNNIVNIKQVEKYRVCKLFSKDVDLAACLETIISGWSFIRAKIAKRLYSAENLDSLPKDFAYILDKIYNAEVMYIKKMLSGINKL